jgi:hypothetical protein
MWRAPYMDEDPSLLYKIGIHNNNNNNRRESS